MRRSVHGVQRGANSQQQLENQHFSAGLGRRRPALSRLLVGAHCVDVFKGQILPGGEDGYHDELPNISQANSGRLLAADELSHC